MKPFATLLCAVGLLIVCVLQLVQIDATALGLSFGLVCLAIADMNVKQLREHGGKIAEQMRGIRDRFNELRTAGKSGADLWPDDSKATWDRLNQEYKEVETRINALEEEASVLQRMAEIDDFQQRALGGGTNDSRPGLDDRPPGSERSYGELGLNRDQARQYQQSIEDRSIAFDLWAGFGTPEHRATDRQREACERLQFNPSTREIRLRLLDTDEYGSIQARMRAVHPDLRHQVMRDVLDRPEQRALGTLTGASGGFITAPPTVVRSIELAMIQFGAILQVADTMTTETGEEMGWPYGDDTSNEGTYVDENQDSSSSTADPSFEQVKWGAYDFHSKWVKVPYKLFRDSFVPLGPILGQMIGERLGRKLSSECTTGAAKIRGIVTRSAAGQTSAAATSIAYADFVGLEHSIDPGLRTRLEFMFHDAILEALRLLVDDQNRPLFISNLSQGMPDTIGGRRFVVNQNMASSIVASAKTMLAGDLRSYKIRRVGPSLRLVRAVERFAEYDQTGFLGYISADGNLLRPQAAASCPVKHLVQTT